MREWKHPERVLWVFLPLMMIGCAPPTYGGDEVVPWWLVLVIVGGFIAWTWRRR